MALIAKLLQLFNFLTLSNDLNPAKPRHRPLEQSMFLLKERGECPPNHPFPIVQTPLGGSPPFIRLLRGRRRVPKKSKPGRLCATPAKNTQLSGLLSFQMSVAGAIIKRGGWGHWTCPRHRKFVFRFSWHFKGNECSITSPKHTYVPFFCVYDAFG